MDDPNANGRNRETSNGGSKNWWYLLLLVPFVALMYPPLYAFDEPRIGGVPFFYWYQLLWLFLSAGIVTTVYRLTR